MGAGATGGVACVGNWILDVVHDLPVWPQRSDLVHVSSQSVGLGGGAANVAGDLAAMRVPYPIHAVGAIGDDIQALEIVRLCDELGLNTDSIRRLAGTATSQCHVMNVPGDSRTFLYHAGANDAFGPDDVDVEGLAAAGCRIFYLGYLNLLARLDHVGADGRSAAAELLRRVRQAGMRTCVDLVSSHQADYARTVRATLPEIDVLFLNEVEAERATGRRIRNATDVEGMRDAAKALADAGVREAVILHSAERTLWLEGGQEELCTPVKLRSEEIVSSVGAGDAFAAGIIHGLHEGWDRAACIRLAFVLAADCLRGRTATDGIRPLEEIMERPGA